MADEQKVVYVHCANCGKALLAGDESHWGDDAWFICEQWFCEDCAEDLFKREVTADDFV